MVAKDYSIEGLGLNPATVTRQNIIDAILSLYGTANTFCVNIYGRLSASSNADMPGGYGFFKAKVFYTGTLRGDFEWIADTGTANAAYKSRYSGTSSTPMSGWVQISN